jgi:hypothetical protein
MKVAFHTYQLGERGTEVCLYKYAKYNQEILGNESLIISTSSRPTPSLDLFEKEFETILYPEIWVNDGKNLQLRRKLESVVSERGITHFYSMKGGENDGILPGNTKSIAHCVFMMHEPHGDVYAGISKYVSDKFGGTFPYVDYIVENEFPGIDDLRDQLGIPRDAIVIGRHGGTDTFDLNFAKEAIIDSLERSDLYFIFMNTDRFYNHERIIHLPYSFDIKVKSRFVETCDAMIHARSGGETFGLSIGEFSAKNKPIITCNSLDKFRGHDTAHLDFLGPDGIYYKDRQSLKDILMGIDKKYISEKNWDVYSERFSPKNVMKQFNEVFLK